MKPFVALASFLVLVSLACSASKSAGSERVVNQNAEIQSASTTTSSNTNQEKQPCTLTLAGAPTINGLRLGMTTNELFALFPGSQDDAELQASVSKPANKFGGSSFVIQPGKYGSKERFLGIGRISISLFDQRVSGLYIGYDGPKWPHVDKFVAKFVEGTNLPAPDQWESYPGMDTQMKTLRCKGFEIRLFAGGQGGSLNYADIRDLDAEKSLNDRTDKASAQASPTPKQ